jgi:hypothetical protein
MTQLIRCLNCDEIFMETPYDQSPEYEYVPTHPSEPVRSIERDDFQDFLIKHRGHRLEYLEIIEDSFISEKAYSEPVKIAYFNATNGKESFVIKKFRERIDEPLKYELIPGDYSLKCLGIEIQSEGITKQLRMEFEKPPFSPTQISAFPKLYRRIAGTGDTKNLERVSEDPSHPLEIYYKMDDVSLFYLLRNCRNLFKGKEYSSIEEFINRHKDDGVLLLKARYKIQITEKAKTRNEAISAVVPAEVKKIIKKE